MRSRIRIAAAAAALVAAASLAAPAFATAPSLAQVDAQARAAGNRKDVAVKIGEAIFATSWPAQISQISANQLGTHLIVGLRLWGVKFHQPIGRAAFVAQVVGMAGKTFAAQPGTEEIDLWASVPISVGKGVIVSGDLAKPTSRVVYSISIRRGESAAALAARAAGNHGVFWDEDWARSAFKE